ncbi:MAG: DEAD/DEAH box helicase [Lachnospiraceae bacterium]
MNFEEVGLSREIVEGLRKEKITVPTKVQELVIRKITQNKDLVVQSETGTGKTLAYLLPFYQSLDRTEKGMKVLILVPTHELAMQVFEQIKRLSLDAMIPMNGITIFGDVNITRQIEKLREKPQIIIGTTGRILELIKKKKITAHTIQSIVIDEADKMLDQNNIETVKAIVKCCMRDTQLLFFSASIDKKTQEKAEMIAKEPEIIKITDKIKIPTNIEHIYFVVERREKIEQLRKIAASLNPKKALIFINKTAEIEEATEKLKYHNYNAECIHGGCVKGERKKAIENFQSGKLQFLIATDIAARGLHIDGISAVFHVSIPEDNQDYLHRAGRTGRGCEQGLSILIVTKEELGKVRELERTFGISMKPKKMSQGKIVEQ